MKNICCIFGAMPINKNNILINDFCYIIAADKGYEHLKNIDVVPDYVIGDFDSLGYIPNIINPEIHSTHKDDTDTMLAVKHGLKLGFKKFFLFGCLGGKLSHTLANIQTLSYICKNNAIGFLVSDNSVITVWKDNIAKFNIDTNTPFSIFALKNIESLSITGAEYNVENITLKSDFPLGVSNMSKDTMMSIYIKSGTISAITENIALSNFKFYLNKPFPFKYAIFDLDGTILNSNKQCCEITRTYLLRNNKYIEANIDEKLMEMSMEESSAYLHKNYFPEFSPQQIQIDIENRFNSIYKNPKSKNGVCSYIQKLYDNGIRICIATATNRDLTETALKKLNIFQYISFVLTCGELKTTKKSDYIYSKALTLFNCNKQEAIIFEDSSHAINTAINNNFRVAVVKDEFNSNKLKDIFLKCECIIDNFEDLLLL